MAMSDAEIRFSTAIDPSGFQDGIGDANATLGKMQQAVSGVAKATQEAFGPSAQTKINKLGEQLKNAQAQYERLMSGEVQPRSLQVMERQLNSNQKEASKLEAQMGSLQAALSSGFALPGQAEQLEILKSRLSEIDGESESLIHKMNQIQLNPESSAEAEKLRNKIERVSKEMTIVSQKSGKAFNDMPKRAHAASGAFEKLANRIKRLVIAAFVFNIIRRGLSQLRDYMGGLLSTNAEFVSSLNAIKVNLATAFQPIFEAILPAINALMSALANATAYIAQFISMLFGKSYNESKDAAKNLNKEAEAIKNVGGAAKSAGKSLASFDEINQQAAESSGGGGSADAGFSDKFDAVTSPEFDMSWWDGISKALQPTIDAFWGLWEAVKPFAGMIGEGLAWFYDNVLVPLAGWVFSALIPKLFEVLEKFFIAIAPIVRAVGNGLIRLWDSFLKPLAKWTGQLVVNVLGFLCDVLVAIGQWAEKYSDVIEVAAIVIGGFFLAFVTLKGITAVVTTVRNALKTFSGALSSFLSANWMLLVVAAVSAIGMAIADAHTQVIKARLDKAYDQTFGNVTLSVEECAAAIGEFSTSSARDLSSVTEKLKPEADQWKEVFVTSSESFGGLVEAFSTGGQIITEETLPTIMESLETMSGDLRAQLDAEKAYQTAYWTTFYEENDGVVDVGEKAIIDTIAENYGTKHERVDELEKEITEIYKREIDEQGRLTQEGMTQVNELIAEYHKLANMEVEKANLEHMFLLRDLKTGRKQITEESYDNYIQAIKDGEASARKLAEANRLEQFRLLTAGLEEGTEEYTRVLADINGRYDKELANIGTQSEEAIRAMAEQFMQPATDAIGKLGDMNDQYKENEKTIEGLRAETDKLRQQMNSVNDTTEEGLAQWGALNKEVEQNKLRISELGEENRRYAGKIKEYQSEVRAQVAASVGTLNKFIKEQDRVAEDFAVVGKATGVNYAEGLTLGLTDSQHELVGTWREILGDLLGAGNLVLGIHSPSTVAREMGDNLNAGLELGITQTSGGVVAAFTSMFNTILSHLQTFANHFLRGWRDMILQSAELARVVPDAPRITVPGFNPIAIPRLATGGLINAPTIAMIGERGREAVLPLDRNTGWMDDLADRLADRIGAAVGGSGGGDTIILEIDRRELGRVVVPAYDGEKRRMGVRIQPRGTLS